MKQKTSSAKIGLITTCLLLVPILGWAQYGSNPPAADNTEMNKRDESRDTLLSENQAQASKNDAELTRLIRKELTNDKQLSIYSQNIKIMTINGNVTLRGPVHTNKEKAEVQKYAQKVVGRANINNEIEVTNK